MTICPRCLEHTSSVHTCTATEFVGQLEAEIERLKLERDDLERRWLYAMKIDHDFTLHSEELDRMRLDSEK